MLHSRVFELQGSQLLILPPCGSGACKTVRFFLESNDIFCLQYEILQNQKNPHHIQQERQILTILLNTERWLGQQNQY